MSFDLRLLDLEGTVSGRFHDAISLIREESLHGALLDPNSCIGDDLMLQGMIEIIEETRLIFRGSKRRRRMKFTMIVE
jgi:hypothetical protein